MDTKEIQRELSRNPTVTEFRTWLDEVDTEVYDINKGSFKTSGTMVGGNIVTIDK